MRAKTVNEIPTFSELYDLAPKEIKDYIDKCDDTPQGTDWHPEGCVGIHLRLVYDRARDYGDIDLAIAAFFHDLGKVDTTAINKRGGYSAIGHERVSARLVEKYKNWIESLGADWKAVYDIVSEHMRIKQLPEMRPTKQQKLRAHPQFDRLQKFTEFDSMKTLTDEELNRYK